MSITIHKRLLQIAKREVMRIATKPMYLFCMVIAPVFSYIFFTTLMSSGLPTNMPAGVVDLDNTSTTRTIIRNLDAFQQTKIVAHYNSFNEAREAVQRGEIYSFYYIPQGTTEKQSQADSLKFLLHKLFVPDSRLTALPRPTYHERTGFGGHRTKYLTG